MFPLYLALSIFIIWLITGLVLVIGYHSLGLLKDALPRHASPLPAISIIIPARNEEKNIREALQTILLQDYGNLECIVVNDRSTDGTGNILAEMEKTDPRLHVYEITGLPRGWLGKNHALQCGAEKARGEILLFTDADVIMQPDTVARAAGYLHDRRIDHLCIMPGIRISGPLMGIFVMTFGIFFMLYAMPWLAARPHGKKHIGIGAFNMLRAEVYRAIGGHQPIALRPDDDMKLGKLVRKNGYRQEMLHGTTHLAVEWYGSMRELIAGLMKNAFAGVEYSITAIILATFFQLLLIIWPFPALFINGGWTLLVNLATVFIMLAVCVDTLRTQGLSPWYCIGFPLGTLLFLFILWRAMILNIRNGGITWRGTYYSLAELKSNKV